jgi:hypothetical protein
MVHFPEQIKPWLNWTLVLTNQSVSSSPDSYR